MEAGASDIDTGHAVELSDAYARNARFPQRRTYIPYAVGPALGLERLISLGFPVEAGHVAFRLMVLGRIYIQALDPGDDLTWLKVLDPRVTVFQPGM